MQPRTFLNLTMLSFRFSELLTSGVNQSETSPLQYSTILLVLFENTNLRCMLTFLNCIETSQSTCTSVVRCHVLYASAQCRWLLGLIKSSVTWLSLKARCSAHYHLQSYLHLFLVHQEWPDWDLGHDVSYMLLLYACTIGGGPRVDRVLESLLEIYGLRVIYSL